MAIMHGQVMASLFYTPVDRQVPVWLYRSLTIYWLRNRLYNSRGSAGSRRFYSDPKRTTETGAFI